MRFYRYISRHVCELGPQFYRKISAIIVCVTYWVEYLALYIKALRLYLMNDFTIYKNKL